MRTHTPTLFVIVLLLLSATGIQVIAQQKKVAKNFNRICTFHYPDGTLVKFHSRSDLDRFDILDPANKYNMGWIVSVHHDSVKVHCTWPGQYVMTFSGKTIARFTVSEKEGKLISDLPPTLTLPFYSFFKAPPKSILLTYSLVGKQTGHYQTDDKGRLFLSQKPDVQKEAFLVCTCPGYFPEIKTLETLSAKEKPFLTKHIITFTRPSRPPEVVAGNIEPYQYNKSVVHNLKEDAFYKIIKSVFPKTRETYLWLAVYHPPKKQVSHYPIPIEGNRKNVAFALYLDETGQPVVVISQQVPKTYVYTPHFYKVNSNGTFEPFENKVYPRYAFKGNYFEGPRWIIPSECGIILKPGMHTYKVTCTGSWQPPDIAAQKRAQRIREINERIYHGGKLAEGEYQRLLKEKSTLESTKTPPVPREQVERSVTTTKEVVFSPNEKYLYKIIEHKNDNPPSAESHNNFSDMDIQKCSLYIDGNGPIGYSFTDEMAGKSVSNADFDSEEERAKALKYALDNATVYVGYGERGAPIGISFNLFKYPDVIAKWPLNLWEGPYPTLRYKVQIRTGAYKTYDEARKHCKNPESHYKTYTCYRDSIIQVCPDKYSFSFVNGCAVADTAALYCGKETAEVYMPHGENILVVVSAKGYRAQTLALDKKDLQVSDIHLSGTITDKSGHPLKGVKIAFIGKDVSFVTDSTGKYKLEGKAHGKEPFTEILNIKLEPVDIEVTVDTLGLYDPQKNFGVVADGFTTLKLHIKANGIDPASLVVQPPALGDFVPRSPLKIPLVLDKSGEGDMEYVPPEYLKNSFLTQHLKIKEAYKGPHGLSGDLWAADVPISISYEDKDGNPGTFIFHIKVCRPPVMLVHGFTGDESTWEHLAVQLRHDKYDAIIREYYQGTLEQSSIETQAQKLDFYIRELRKAYYHNGIIQNRVDIVAHSMGGLISRYYISNMPKYGKKAGLAIPYGVRLSREQLKQLRFQQPVILNTVRKLIMVGTPNHGASFLDERLGALNALRNDVHQIANEQLRYDSPFLTRLNAGESEGRHLAPNVQYAIIYGLRRRSQIYPLDNILYPVHTAMRDLAPDDGVVSKESALLNGVKSYAFPPDPYVYKYGYIHSPVLANLCEGDAPITNDPKIFDKIEALLQEDIPRVPLKNSVTRITHAEGELFMRYYATQKWIQLRTPITYLQPKKLTYNFCRLKTGEGTATLGFFLNGHQWGGLMVQPHTIVYYDYGSPEDVRIYLQQGKARFRSKKQNGGGFEVVMGDKTGEKWYAFNPKARVKDLNTDFIVEQDSILNVQSISGKVVISVPPKAGKKPVTKTITTRGGLVLLPNDSLTNNPLPDSGWWMNTDTAFLPDYIYDTARFMLPENRVHFTFSGPYLPVSGFSTLDLHVDSLPEDSVKRSYRVEVSLHNASLLPFITITRPEGITDSLGDFKTEITFREPAPGDYISLGNLPLQARFNIRLFKQQSDTLVFQRDTLVPLGMTLITGKTTGPGFRPRKEPPPRLNQIIYQIVSESDSTGHFYLLFNTTSYDKNRRQLEKLAGQTQQNTVHRMEHFVLQWPEDATFPLTFQLDSLKKDFLPGEKITIGKNGMLDILTPAEQENRLKNIISSFVKAMPLTKKAEAALLKKLDSLSFRYSAETQTPVWLFRENAIAIPGDSRTCWNLNNKNTSTVYTSVLSALGHFLQQSLCNNHHRHFAFLQSGKQEPDSALFNVKAYRTFHRTEAGFFRYLLENFLTNKGNGLVTKSVFYQKTDTAKMSLPVRFLIHYYGNLCQQKPALVYCDFLFTEILYSDMTANGEPAGTIRTWLQAKMKNGRKAYIVKTSGPLPLVRKYGLLPDKQPPMLLPEPDFAGSSLQIGEKTVNNFSNIPAILLNDTMQIRINSGKFLILFPATTSTGIVLAGPGSHFKIDEQGQLLLLKGTFNFRDSIPSATPLFSIVPRSNNFTVSINEKSTTLNVYQGEVELKNEKAGRVIHQNEASTVSKSRNIKKPKPMKAPAAPAPLPKATFPFVFTKD
jgi:pimeloyl-ACP methyl ester carboxylesterase